MTPPDWLAPLTRLGATAADEAWPRVVAAYAEPQRHYHTLRHVEEVVALLHQFGSPTDATLLAGWLHDFVYDPRAADNEERSATQSRELLGQLGVSADTNNDVTRLIRATAHAPGDVPPDAALLLDADLAILGADEVRYVAYAAAIRREYDWVPSRHYRDGRRKVLLGFLERERIFRTASFHAAREEAARRNLTWEIETLG